MKKTAILFAALLAASSINAQEQTAAASAKGLDPKIEKAVRESLTKCSDLRITQSELPQRLPAGMSGSIVTTESARPSCIGRFVAVTTNGGSYYVGLPWFLGETPGATSEEKLKNFAWASMQQSFAITVGRERTRDGLFPVTLVQTAEAGKVPIEGEIDANGTVFFMGHFRPMNSEVTTSRLKAFAPFIADAPTRGAAKPDVTVVEFSDFQCPSCKHSSTYMDPIMEKHSDRVRYVRFDLPLVQMHPWAFPAAVAGRAVYMQKPELFWDYKKAVYGAQEQLSAFTIDDFVRGFAQDHDLDMKKFDADVASQPVRDEILKGVGAAFTYEVRATPTYMVNGVFIDPGDDGKELAEYVDALLKK